MKRGEPTSHARGVKHAPDLPPHEEFPALQGRIRSVRSLVSLAVLAFGAAYFFIPDHLRFGPPWLLLLLLVIAIVVYNIGHRRGNYFFSRRIAFAALTLITLAVIGSAVSLVLRLPGGKLAALDLLRDGGIVWLLNWFVFAFWYWEVDTGGPVRRHLRAYVSRDFIFPQATQHPYDEEGWQPGFVDYLFLAFNTSTAFSPTDTLVLSQRMKVLMMIQTVVSLVTLAVLIARSINTLT